eukprot:CAMPEP_0184022474 /NCGR_PEP_ID=MMETSP0954-20121128/10629_1 /TAXON_ID=627963 /ORGANISM="Aplanochytrium sp, Strain PBS07" /LENGTH=330 /DNA_ID=CAMNT_0026304859 /DNA_START=158 /DNA_END=1147 /DNA_ORIENTATION=+
MGNVLGSEAQESPEAKKSEQKESTNKPETKDNLPEKNGMEDVALEDAEEAKKEEEKFAPEPTDSLKIGNIECKTFSDEHFARIRAYFKIPNSFAADAAQFDFKKMAAAGGKGGDPMAKTTDKKYIIKEVNSDDHETLLEIAKGMAEHFIDKTEPSVMVPIFAHFTRTEKKTKKTYFAMTNCLTDPGPYKKIYDLKGCADDKLLTDKGNRVPEVHKRVWKAHLWCGCGGSSRSTYLKGKIEALHSPDLLMTKDQKNLLMKAIRSDCAFMKKYGLMDYSLLVAVVEKDVTEESTTSPASVSEVQAGTPLLCTVKDGKERKTYVGVIDFLQQW